MRKEVRFVRAKFMPEIITAAEGTLGLSRPRTSNLSVAINDDETWTFDKQNEFFAQYRQPCSRASYGNRDDEYGISFYFTDGYDTRITISAPTRGEIEDAFSIFEQHREISTKPAPPPPPKPLPAAPRVFIGHGRSPDWRDLKDHLHEQHHYDVEAYETGARTGHAIRDVLDVMLNRAAFAVLVLTAEDEVIDGHFRPRENVVHETGLFQGRLGWTRAIMLVEEGVEPFSNVAGIQQIRYQKGQIRSTYGDALAALRREFGTGPFRK